MSYRSVRLSAILLLLVFGIANSETRTPAIWWRDVVKRPLSGAKAEELFAKQYKDALLPGDSATYLEGSVVSVVQTPSTARKLLLSMERNGTADAALLFDGRAWTLKAEPQKSTIVRFAGVARDFTKEPFLITFEPYWIEGFLDLETTESNRRFPAR